MIDRDEVHSQVRSRYAEAAHAVITGGATGTTDGCCPPPGGTGEALQQNPAVFGAGLYAAQEHGQLPQEAVLASLGCGNPVAVATLHPGETVLDLGSGGGIDVLLSARRVGPTGYAYGVDMTDEMLALARANAERAGATNVAFLKGTIEDLPLADASVDVVISNCVINLSPDKPAVLHEMFRVLRPGGRIGISDVVAEDHLAPEDRAERGSFSGCIAGALSRQEYLTGLAQAGFIDPEVRFTHQVEPQMHAAIIQATKPGPDSPTRASRCCDPDHQTGCCTATAEPHCCTPGNAAPHSTTGCTCR